MTIFPTKILLATDGSEDAQLAATTAVDLTKKLDSELLHVVYVEPMPEKHISGLMRFRLDLPAEVVERVEQDAETKLEEQVQKIRKAGDEVAQAHRRAGLPDAEILALAEELGVGLIVVGSRGRGGIRRALMGSVSDSVVRHAHCPVMVARGEPLIFPGKILLATDGSEEAELAATAAAELAKSTASELQVAHVAAQYSYARAAGEELPDVAQQVLDEQVSRLQHAGVTAAEAHVRVGPPAAVIVALTEHIGAQLIIMGSRGMGGIRRALMGSVSDSVVSHAHCAVMVVRE
jgi:nucleotide-binding universal stress UspA family protein